MKEAGAKQVVHFHLFKGNRLMYSIFFGTSHTRGSDCMKQAIWKIDPFGDFSFRGGEREQIVLLDIAQANFDPLGRTLKKQFGDTEYVSIEDVIEFVESDRTIYHSGQLKTLVLKPMETDGLVHVDPSSRQRRFTYPPGCLLNFNPPQQSLL